MSCKLILILLLFTISISGVYYSWSQNFWRDHDYVKKLYTDNPRRALIRLTTWELNRHRKQVEYLLNDTSWRETSVLHKNFDGPSPKGKIRCDCKIMYGRNCDYALMRLLFHPNVIKQFPHLAYTTEDFRNYTGKQGYIEPYRVLEMRYNPSRLAQRRWNLETTCNEYYAIPDSLFTKIRECYYETVHEPNQRKSPK